MKLAIGLMSGTSMDGVDAALIRTDGEDFVEEIAATSVEYNSETRHILREAEAKIRGEIAAGSYNKDNYEKVSALSTSIHIQAVLQLLEKTGYSSYEIDVIGYHGQTMYHDPANKVSIIIGDGAHMAKMTRITTINDFRSNDIKHGGNGAPFAPIYHLALAKRDGRLPLAVVNCGGIANITLLATSNPYDMIAYDTGPGNGLIDRLVYMRTKGREHMDKNGNYGMKGRVHTDILEILYQKSIIKNGNNFFDITPPKALDIGDMILPPELDELSTEDACRTLEAFTADSIVRSVSLVKKNIPKNWVLAGGGWNNPVILEELKKRLHEIGITAVKADQINWNSQALEAQIFAYLAVRSMKELNLSFPGTTGVSAAVSGGIIIQKIINNK